jgi:epoxyqueuosine reductase
MTPERYAELVPGTALARAGYDGLRRNAAYALGARARRGAVRCWKRWRRTRALW